MSRALRRGRPHRKFYVRRPHGYLVRAPVTRPQTPKPNPTEINTTAPSLDRIPRFFAAAGFLLLSLSLTVEFVPLAVGSVSAVSPSEESRRWTL
ncbi:hypothetical protein BHE74_00022631 [Ensete ventricosum]|nr:hypothetical protein GW17_00005613 [Ensete ventricosum]RWW69741.1 hypothetical protein BHE74_00022631 [Ensete ventricosum]